MLDDSRAEGLEHGHELAAYPGAKEAGVMVRGVERMRYRVAGDMRVDVGAARSIEGADTIAIEGR